MTVKINNDEKTVTCISSNNQYQINGLVVKKDEAPDAFYEFGNSMCNCICARGTTSKAINIGDGKINLI
jgi:hypothetical protein